MENLFGHTPSVFSLYISNTVAFVPDDGSPVTAIMISFVLLLLVVPLKLVTSQTIWPEPQQVSWKEETLLIDPMIFEFSVDRSSPDCNITKQAFQRYFNLLFDRRCPGDKESVRRLTPAFLPHPVLPGISVSFQRCEEFPFHGMNESYTIKIKNHNEAKLSAKTSWGIIRGLETLSQIIVPTKESKSWMFAVNCTEIFDYPRFPYRGVMIDTSRHFIPMAILKQNLDAMAFNKMNVFHWHLVDDQSFPYESIRFPELQQKGAYNVKTHTFSQADVQEIIEYARLRGIRVIPEFDTPGHTLSWNAIPDLLTRCYENSRPSGKFGPMNPILNSTYEFLFQFLQEVAHVFPDQDVHVGGDEVDFSCWESNPQIKSYMQQKRVSQSFELQQMFMERLMRITDRLGKDHIVWQEVFDKGSSLSNRSIVHVWLGNWAQEYRAKLKEITGRGIRAILSSPWYLNHIKYGIDWQEFYTVEPLAFDASRAQKKLVIGGSVCMWTEFVDGGEIIARTWPRASAVAERLWSSSDTRLIWWAGQRIQRMQCLMQQRGIRVGSINGPTFCQCDHTFT